MLLPFYVFLQHFESIFVVMCFILSKICSLSLSLSNRHSKCQEFLVQNVRVTSGISGICDLKVATLIVFELLVSL